MKDPTSYDVIELEPCSILERIGAMIRGKWYVISRTEGIGGFLVIDGPFRTKNYGICKALEFRIDELAQVLHS